MNLRFVHSKIIGWRQECRIAGSTRTPLAERDRWNVLIRLLGRRSARRGGFQNAAGRPGCSKAFSLLELLVVISIIGLLATLGMPALKGIGQSNTMSAASRQVLDDVALARMMAINGRTTVFMVFVPPSFFDQANRLRLFGSGADPIANDPVYRNQITNIINMQYTGYAIVSRRSLGDQPGQPFPKYLTEWKKLPDGIFFATHKFNFLQLADWYKIQPPTHPLVQRPFPYLASMIPFPSASGISYPVPYIAFNSRGQLVRFDGYGNTLYADEDIPLVKGSIFYPTRTTTVMSGAKRMEVMAPVFDRVTDIVPSPGLGTAGTNTIRINAMSGRARILKEEMQ